MKTDLSLASDKRVFTVVTTIHGRTTAIAGHEAIAGEPVIIVGDRKTPSIEPSANSIVLDVDAQSELDLRYAANAPWNHYARKNIGYLYAMREGADLIYDTDDDNLPMRDWFVPDDSCDLEARNDHQYLNPYALFSDQHVWPRGLPLNQVLPASNALRTTAILPQRIGVWQGLADRDPDVDAVYRLTINEPVEFRRHPSVCIPVGVYCPFNSQNTFFFRPFFLLMYLPSTVSFRFADILRGYIAQRLLWTQGACLGVLRATVVQERNEHDFMQDFIDEQEMYLLSERVVRVLSAVKLQGTLKDMFLDIYRALQDADVVSPHEIDRVSDWVEDYEQVTA